MDENSAVETWILNCLPGRGTVADGISLDALLLKALAEYDEHTLAEVVDRLKHGVLALLAADRIRLIQRVDQLEGKSYQAVDFFGLIDVNEVLEKPEFWIATDDIRIRRSRLLVSRSTAVAPTPHSHWKRFGLVTLICLASTFFFCGIGYFLFIYTPELGRARWPNLPYYVSTMLTMTLWLSLLIMTWSAPDVFDKIIGSRGLMFGLFASYLGFIYPMLFASFCREWSSRSPSRFVGVVPNGEWQWIGFAYDKVVNALLWNSPQEYGASLSSIQPSGFVATTVVFAYELVIVLVLIRGLMILATLFKRPWVFARQITETRV